MLLRILLLFPGLYTCYALQAQHVIFYLDKEFKTCDSIQAVYFRIVAAENDSTLTLEEFKISGGKIRKADIYCKRFNRRQHFNKEMISKDQLKIIINNSDFVLHGEVRQYYLNGNQMSVGRYDNDKKQGAFNYWYFNGSKKGEFVYDDSLKIDQQFKILEFYDSLGKQWTFKGNGIYFNYEHNLIADSGKVENGLKEGEWRGKLWDGELLFSEQFKMGKLQHGISTDLEGKTYNYDKSFVQAEYRNGGLQGLYQFLGNNLKYPASARRAGIDGTVYVQFVIDKDGSMTNIQIIRGLTADLNKESIRVVTAIGNNFEPGLFKGQRTKSKYVLPIRFKLAI